MMREWEITSIRADVAITTEMLRDAIHIVGVRESINNLPPHRLAQRIMRELVSIVTAAEKEASSNAGKATGE